MPVLTNSGVNSLNANTPFKINQITPKLLGYDIAIFTAHERGESKSIMRVTYSSQDVMIITPTKMNAKAEYFIETISITSNYIKNPLGVKIGDSYKEEAFSTCQNFQEKLVCKEKGFDKIELIFNKDRSQQWILKEIVWNARV